MAPLPEPGPTPQICPRCGVALPDAKPPYCPNCGMTLQQRPVWLTVIAAVVSTLLGIVGLGLGAFGACGVLLSGGFGALGPQGQWVWGLFGVALLCIVASIAILVWMIKKPKR